MDNKENPATARKAIVEPKLRATPPKIKALNVEHITDDDMNKERANLDIKVEELLCVVEEWEPLNTAGKENGPTASKQ